MQLQERGLGAAPPLPASGALTTSFGRLWALLGFISRVANLEVPSCRAEDRVGEAFCPSPHYPPADPTLALVTGANAPATPAYSIPRSAPLLGCSRGEGRWASSPASLESTDEDYT